MGFVSEDGRRAYLEAYDETLELAPLALVTADLPTPFGTTHVATAGRTDAPPLVVLHGKHCSSTMWLDLLPTLVTTHRAHLVDCPGDLGKTVTTKMMTTAGDVARWLDAVLDGLGIERAAFVGFSWGGFHSITYATERPGRVERLALLAPVGGFGHVPLSYWVSIMGTLGGDRDAKMETFWRRHYVGTEPSPLQARFDHQFLVGSKYLRTPVRDRIATTFRKARVAKLTMPVLVVFADQDVLQDATTLAAKVADRLPDARVEVVSGAGHMLTFDQLDAVAALVGSFLAPVPA
jgi:pimeloyl-ACP methyl ester carboxylesterase